MKLKNLAHIETGDNGTLSGLSVIAYKPEYYQILKDRMTSEFVKEFFSEIRFRTVIRQELDHVGVLNFIMGMAFSSPKKDSYVPGDQGKAFGMALSELDI